MLVWVIPSGRVILWVTTSARGMPVSFSMMSPMMV
jgi:hypothetical protein